MPIGELLADLQGRNRQDGATQRTSAAGAAPILKKAPLAIHLNAVEGQVAPGLVVGLEFVVNPPPVFVWVAEGQVNKGRCRRHRIVPL